MIIVLHGKDIFRSTDKLSQIIEEYRKKRTGINLKILDGKVSFIDLKDEGRQMGMFEEKKLIIGKGLLERKDLKKEIEDNLEELASQDNILILHEEDEIKGKIIKEFKNLDEKEGMIKKYDKLKGLKLKNWYLREARNQKADFDKRALNCLIEKVGDDLWRAKNEINKLANMHRKEKITETRVRECVRGDFETDVFKTIDALGKDKKKIAIDLFEEHLKKGDSPFYILSMINYQLRNILVVKELQERNISYDEMKKRSGMSPFVFSKIMNNFKDFSFIKAKKIHRDLFAMDLEIKSGNITPEMGLSLVISLF